MAYLRYPQVKQAAALAARDGLSRRYHKGRTVDIRPRNIDRNHGRGRATDRFSPLRVARGRARALPGPHAAPDRPDAILSLRQRHDIGAVVRTQV